MGEFLFNFITMTQTPEVIKIDKVDYRKTCKKIM